MPNSTSTTRCQFNSIPVGSTFDRAAGSQTDAIMDDDDFFARLSASEANFESSSTKPPANASLMRPMLPKKNKVQAEQRKPESSFY